MQFFKMTISFFVGILFLSGCSSKFVIKSDPADANVYMRALGSEDKISVGKTPLTLSQNEVLEKSKIDPSSGEFFELILEKKDFQTEKLLIPASRMGHRETVILTKLKPGQDEGRMASLLLQHLFNAQKMANQNNFESAQSELDKALEMDATFVRAMSLRGSIYFLQHNYNESLKWFEKALAIDPQFEDALKMIAQIKKASGESNAH